jgi:hypothetical protein
MDQSASRFGRVVAIVLVAAAIACAWLPSIQDRANQQVDEGLKRAVVSFAAAKTLNAAISVAQGTELAFQPVGVGVTVTLGQALDPLNDLVEQFATLMLTASVAFGVQKVLLAIGAHWLVSAAVTAIAVVWALLWWRGSAPPWLSRLLLVLVMVRFAVPVITIGGDWIFQNFLAGNYEQAQGQLDKISLAANSNGVPLPAKAKNEGLWDKITQWTETAEKFDPRARLADLQETLGRATDYIVDVMVVFVMQTIVVPLIFLWILFKIVGGVVLWRASPAAR